jgi:ubiquitin C-terminal hydrolase
MFTIGVDSLVCDQFLTAVIDYECKTDRNRAIFAPRLVEDLVERHFSTIQLDPENQWHCDACHRDSCASRRIRLLEAPPNLVIQLKRFKLRGAAFQRDNATVVIPVELDLTKFFLNDEQAPLKYKLVAVLNHFGSLRSGHYTAFGKREENWFYFNDENVTEREPTLDGSADPYMLYYTRYMPN